MTFDFGREISATTEDANAEIAEELIMKVQVKGSSKVWTNS